MSKWTIAIFAMMAMLSNAQAMTAAQFVQADRTFAMGYVLGLLRYKIDVADDNDPEAPARIGKCMQSSGIKLETVYDLAIADARAHPEEMGYPAVGAVLRTISKICP